jgi:hypothetical protein
MYPMERVKQGVFQVFMTEQDLNSAEIRAGLIEMRSKTVAKPGEAWLFPSNYRQDRPIDTKTVW